MSSVEEDIVVNGVYTGISNVEFDGTTASVTLENAEDCILAVALRSTSGKLIGVAVRSLDAGSDSASLTMNAVSLPDEYYIKAFLFDNTDCSPLCEVYSEYISSSG